ncbi:unnamed protein product [Cercopithifilaria johnstoni]|uniref:Uncharacterized protein n=1 Tax=Cercopithifilaria johnstoni TaxID=2874296 RepID=A0A8J2M6F9_9BILA|nr:unnamed protein product [Cercopithifilaria johnstoni]
MSTVMLITTNGMLTSIVLQISSIYFTVAAPVCYNCDSSCNDTVTFNDDNISNFESINSNRIRRTTIEQRSCHKFQLELILIPLSIAMIPFALCALLLSVCFCGPKESRGKVPEMFKKNGKINAKDANEIDKKEFTCKNGIIMRNDSKKTRFSTTISFIEVNCINDEKVSKNNQTIIPNALLCDISEDEEYVAGNYETIRMKNNNQTTIGEILMNEKKLENTKGYI